jgi:O-antigen ligase
MPRQLAAALFVAFIAWLFIRERKRSTGVSEASWLPLIWVAIVGSRPISLWFGGPLEMETPDDYLKGSPIDMMIFLSLIVGGVMVLVRRQVNWNTLFTNNTWLLVFFLYCGLSVAWSDYPFVGFKRWIKDLGNLVMVLVILSEKDPVQAVKSVFLRCAFLLLPLSVLFIKYYPEFGRYYNRWTYTPVYCGVTTEKNALGCLVMVCGLFLAWEFYGMRWRRPDPTPKLDVLSRVLLVAMMFWLLSKAQSSTALVCWVMGAVILYALRFKFAMRQVRALGTYTLAVSLMLLALYSIPGLLGFLLEMLGEDLTFTGRTDLWADLLSQRINPLMGTGYQSFWLGERAEVMWEKYYFHPNQAHNGYIETYLNGGFIGAACLLAWLVAAGRDIKKDLLRGQDYARVRFAALVIGVFYNWTEAVFNRLSLVWIILLLAAVNFRRVARRQILKPGEEPQRIRHSQPSETSASFGV